MFTGLVERTGRVSELRRDSVIIDAGHSFAVAIGDSVSINGVCLTVTSIASGGSLLGFDVSHETVSVTNLSDLRSGDLVNLEKPLAADGRFHGHIVLGHVDTVGTVISVEKKNDMADISIRFEEKFSKWIVSKASIAVNGVSLTVNEKIDSTSLRLTLIPHTLEKTNISGLKAGSRVNLEFDILAKYLEGLLAGNSFTKSSGSITEDFLRRNGYGA